MPVSRLMTVEQLLHIPDSKRLELIEGKISHKPLLSTWSSVCSARLGFELFKFVDLHDLGYVMGANGGYILGRNPDTVMMASFGFLRKEHFPQGLPQTGFSPVPPDLAAEILQSNDDSSVAVRRQDLYDKAGVPEVWWIDIEHRSVKVRRLGGNPETVTSGGELVGCGTLAGLRVRLSTIFDD